MSPDKEEVNRIDIKASLPKTSVLPSTNSATDQTSPNSVIKPRPVLENIKIYADEKENVRASPSSCSAKNWPATKKWTSLMILSSFAFIHPLSETMITPSINVIAHDLKFTSHHDSMLCLSIFLVGIALGPLFLAPVSEVYGRRPILLSGGLFYTIWTTVCGFSKTKVQLFVFRALSGFGASVALGIGGGVIGDVWNAEERARAIAWYLLAPLLGPAIGPIVGGFVTDSQSWHWVFWAFAIASIFFLLVAYFFFPESYQPILQEMEERSEKQTQLRDGATKTLAITVKLIWRNLLRPLRMIRTQPIINILAVFVALLYGIMFLFLFTYPMLWAERYHQSASISSLNYISAGLGFTIGAQVAGHVNDRLYIRLKTRNGGIGKPEFRIPIFIPGALFVAVGLLIYGWTSQQKYHWILPNIGSLIFCGGCMLCTSGVNTYAVDAYTQYAASALSALNVLRNITAIFFPLFAPYLFNGLGFGVGCTVLVGTWTITSALIIAMVLKYGERMRERSRYFEEI